MNSNLTSKVRMIREPEIIFFPVIGSYETGFISVAEQGVNVPFHIKRVYWIYATPNEIIRGEHAHKNLEQVVFAVSGNIEVSCETLSGEKIKFILDDPQKGLFIPKLTWRRIKLSDSAVLLCLASELYSKDDYIRDYAYFKSFGQFE